MDEAVFRHAIPVRPKRGAEGKSVMTYSRMISISAALAASVAGVGAVAPSALARERPTLIVVRPQIATRYVSYADLNLASRAGEKALNRRVGSAVIAVCDETRALHIDFHDEDECRSASWWRARPQITLAVRRARELASTGSSALPLVGIMLAANR
jgi:UrcA family protein